MRCRFCEADNVDAATACARCGGELELPAGTLISGRYEIRRFIGDGGMGTVYLAQDRDLDEAIAIKFLRNEFIRTPTLAKRFRSEIKLARRVSHRNVCKIFDYGQDGGRVYITMAYVDGVDLRKTLRERGPFSPQEAFAMAADVAGALQAVHDEGIVHRDLKTSNVMRDRKGQVQLMDFGVAKDQVGDATELTATGSLIGSPEYMSPELWQGEKADVRSDVYALGIVVYELFTGRVPFRAPNVPALMRRHILDEPPLRGDEATLVPSPLRPVLGQALAKAAAERFNSARQMAEAMRKARLDWECQLVDSPREPVFVPSRSRAEEAELAVEQHDALPEIPKETLPGTASTEVPTLPNAFETLDDAYATANSSKVRPSPAGGPNRRAPVSTSRRWRPIQSIGATIAVVGLALGWMVRDRRSTGAAIATESAPETIVDNYLNAVKSQDDRILNSIALVPFNDPVESWTVLGSRDQPPSQATLPRLADKVRSLEEQLAANKKEASAWSVQNYRGVDRVYELRKRNAPVPGDLADVVAAWDKYNEQDRTLKSQLAMARSEVEAERVAVRRAAGSMDGVERMLGVVQTKEIDVEIVSQGQRKAYTMTLRRYELKHEGGSSTLSRWVVQQLKPRV